MPAANAAIFRKPPPTMARHVEPFCPACGHDLRATKPSPRTGWPLGAGLRAYHTYGSGTSVGRLDERTPRSFRPRDHYPSWNRNHWARSGITHCYKCDADLTEHLKGVETDIEAP